MTKKEKIVIKEIIEFLLNTRTRELAENEENSMMVNSYSQYEENHFDLEEVNRTTMERYDSRLISLNNLLKQEERNQEILEIEKQMIKIQSKKIISVKEYKEIYGECEKAQENDRNRGKNPLPYHQKKKGGKIKYYVEEIEEWREKYNHR